MRIEVTRVSEDFLSVKEWVFWLYDNRQTLYLDAYYELSKPTKRHKLRVDKVYKRVDTRGNTLKVEDVSIPEDVSNEALRRLFESIKVKKWDGEDK